MILFYFFLNRDLKRFQKILNLANIIKTFWKVSLVKFKKMQSQIGDILHQ